MKTITTLQKSLMIAAATAAIAGYALTATAGDDKAGGKEKCYGIAKAGKNDCGGAGASCAGSAKADGQGFIALPKGLCERLAHGSLTEPK